MSKSKYEELLKIREKEHRGALNLRPVDIVVSRRLDCNEVYLESRGVKIICSLYHSLSPPNRKGPFTAEPGRNKEPIEVVLLQQQQVLSVGTSLLDEKKLMTIQSKIKGAFQSAVLLGPLTLESLCVQLTFSLIEADCDPLPYLINSGSVALCAAGVMMRAVVSSAACVFVSRICCRRLSRERLWLTQQRKR